MSYSFVAIWLCIRIWLPYTMVVPVTVATAPYSALLPLVYLQAAKNLLVPIEQTFTPSLFCPDAGALTTLPVAALITVSTICSTFPSVLRISALSAAVIAPDAVAVKVGAADIVVQLGAAPDPPEVNTCPLVP